MIATLGTLAEREIEDAGDAVFGRPDESTSLDAFGRLVFKKVLEISDYLQSVSAQGHQPEHRWRADTQTLNRGSVLGTRG